MYKFHEGKNQHATSFTNKSQHSPGSKNKNMLATSFPKRKMSVQQVLRTKLSA